MRNRSVAALFALLLLAGCAGKRPAGEGRPVVTKAVCVLSPTKGNDVHGVVTFTRDGDEVLVHAEVSGLTPGRHGFHVHEYGDCSAPDGSSAGGHYDPEHQPHGAPSDLHRHVGDLGNITAGDDGKAALDWRDPELRLDGPESIVGRAVVVDAGEDDLKTQPAGGAGAPVACGVIGIAKP
jgi:Cu-Zn family superoxide dismutase